MCLINCFKNNSKLFDLTVLTIQSNIPRMSKFKGKEINIGLISKLVNFQGLCTRSLDAKLWSLLFQRKQSLVHIILNNQ